MKWRIEEGIRRSFTITGDMMGDIAIIVVLLLLATALFYFSMSRPQGEGLLTDIVRAANDLVASGRDRVDPFFEGVDDAYIYSNGTKICVRSNQNQTSINISLPFIGNLSFSPPVSVVQEVCKEIPDLARFEGEGSYDGVIRVDVFMD